MKYVITLFLLLCLGFSGFSQVPNAALQGKVLDPDGGGLGFATVMLISSKDSSLVKAGFSLESGDFELKGLSGGDYLLKITLQGYQPYFSSPFSLKEGEEKQLEPSALSLVESAVGVVEINAQRPLVEVKPDLTVFNVQGTVNSVGDNAFNLLRKAPGVVIDNNDNVMLLGKSGVRVYIDGKPSPLSAADLANFLKGLNSDQIDAFEIITNPSAKFDAEGNAGIINIRLKRDKNMGGNLTLNLDYSVWLHNRFSGGLSGNYRNKRFNAFGSYSAGLGAQENFMDFYRIQSGFSFDQDTRMVRSYVNHNFRAGMDFFLSKKSTFGFVATGFLNGSDNDNTTRNDIRVVSVDSLTSRLISNSTVTSSRNNLAGNLNYRFDNGKGSTLNVDADYGIFQNRTDSYLPNEYRDPVADTVTLARNYFTQAPTDISISTLKADYERPVLKGKLGAGFKFSYVATTNTFDFFNEVDGENVLDSARSNTFDYTENVNAGYLNYSRTVKKWGIQAGVRAEQTNSVGALTALTPTGNDKVERHYLNLFPSGGITFNPNKMNSLRFTYSRRIDRPKYQDLNPFEYKLDELSYMVGNPFLKPQYTHNFEIGHTFMYMYNTTLSYAVTSDYFTQLTDTIEGIRTYMRQENLSTRKVATLSLSAPVKISDWWSTFTNASVFNATNLANFGVGKEIKISRTSFNVFHQSTFSLPLDFSLQLSGFYNSPGIWGANFKNRKFWGMEAGLQKKLFEGRGVFKVGISDIFFTMQWSGVQQYGGLYSEAHGGWESRQIKASYSHTFGNTQMKAAKKRQTGLDDEKSRAGEGGGGPGR